MIRTILSLMIVSIASSQLHAVEYTWHGLIDLRYVNVTNDQSVDLNEVTGFLNADYGKFRFDNNSDFSLAQLAFNLSLDWENNFSARIVSNGYLDGVKDAVGFTEAYLKYSGLANDSGIRYDLRAGIFYPRISMENFVTGWNSPYTLTYSAINSWIGEEVRLAGVEASISRLGKFNQKDYDLSASLALFRNNDPTGTVLSWHGWTLSSRQIFWNETIDLPNDFVRSDGMPLRSQDDHTAPFSEIDGRTGFHLNGEWRYKKKAKVLTGFYDNKAQPYRVIEGQYAWHTRFLHFGFDWKLSDNLTLIGQYLSGDTLMQAPTRVDVVKNDFESAFLLLSKQWSIHRLSGRIETFSVADNDSFEFDDNNESGKAFTLSYAYRLNKNWFLQSEYNWIDSERFARSYHNQSINLIEKQLQFGIRYFF